VLCYPGFESGYLKKNDVYVTRLSLGVIVLLSLFFTVSGTFQACQHYYSPSKIEERLKEKKLIDYCPLSIPLEKC
jgi:hypothetical protein